MYRLRLLLSIYTLKRKSIQCTFCSVYNNGVISFDNNYNFKKIYIKSFQYNVSISPWYNFQLTIIIIITVIIITSFIISISFAIIIIIIIFIIIVIITISMMMMMMII